MRRRHTVEAPQTYGGLGYPGSEMTQDEIRMVVDFAAQNGIKDRVSLIGGWARRLDGQPSSPLKEAVEKFLGVKDGESASDLKIE